MNYEKHYKLLCQTRQQLNRQKLPTSHPDYVYYEWHHVIPKHENGSDEASNLVLLTAREHFIAHWLFAKWKRTRAAWAGLALFKHSRGNSRALNSRQFEIARKAKSIANTGQNNPAYGRPKTLRQIEASRAAGRLGKGRKASPEARANISKAKTGTKLSAETKAKISANHAGISAETRAKQNQTRMAKLNIRLNGHCPVKLVNKETQQIILIEDAKQFREFCKANGALLHNLEKLILGNCKSCKGFMIQ